MYECFAKKTSEAPSKTRCSLADWSRGRKVQHLSQRRARIARLSGNIRGDYSRSSAEKARLDQLAP